ncbi:putative histidine kinase [Streptococcus acidominimus]|uniref:Sensor histidine kinase n=1 Tax=Streptococcus acidominimus TaxID=1326 RepID=A0A239XDL9_STRAI|nr:sensor histidine kinase [Streptococcus acidominimus]SNV44787.1 putative histidine kinase [Streptococcus acidominimus]
MKKSHITLLFVYALVIVFSIVTLILDSFHLSIKELVNNVEQLNQFIFSIVLLTISLTIMLLFVSMLLNYNSHRRIFKNLRRIVHNQPIETGEDELSQMMMQLSEKTQSLTQQLQRTENVDLAKKEDIIQEERKRIARDLHDTVSQELFAAVMILSGISYSLPTIDRDSLQEQLKNTEAILTNAQNDLRVMLLHLRPTELEGRSLKQGLEMIVQEIQDKSTITVTFKTNLKTLPKPIEDHLFRIVQEFISNTLKHAKADHLDIYLHQTERSVQLKMIDNGVGFDVEEAKKISYGLKNMEDRVTDMAGSFQMISAPNQGVTMTIVLPLVGEYNE